VTGDPASFELVDHVELYLGSAGRLGPMPAQTLTSPPLGPDQFGFQVAICDLDGDDFDERIVTALGGASQFQPGAVYVYPGAPLPVDAPSVTLTAPRFGVGGFGWIVSCGR
jgi:hypothetical protein